MTPKDKEDQEKNYTVTPTNLLADKSNFLQINHEKQYKSLSSNNIPKCKIQVLKKRKSKRLSKNRKSKGRGFLEFSSGDLINLIKGRTNSFSSISNVMKSFSRLPSANKSSNFIPIKTLEYYIKQKILDMSAKLEKEDINFSEIENSSNCNITMPFMSGNKIIKKFHSDSGHDSSSQSHLVNKNENKKKIAQSLTRKSMNKDNYKKELFEKNKEKIFRKIDRKNIVYDSIDDSDIFYERDKIGFYILSDSVFALILDSLIFLCTLFNVIYTPFNLSLTVCFCMNISQNLKYMYNSIDLLYISDLIFSFFRTQYDENLKVIIENEIIIKNYVADQFILDFLEAIPISSIILFLCKRNNDKYCASYSFNFKQILLLFFCYLKQLKLIKIIDRKKNSFTNKILDIIANKHNIEKKYKMIKWAIICIYAIYTFISIHIFIGHLSYPNWIISTYNQNESNFSLYISSFYFLLATLTTVGYGDIVCKSTVETYFQIMFLTVGVCVYSWIVSNVGNYVKNQDYAEIKCNKDERLLEEIRIAYPEMPFKLYHQILQHLKSRKLRQQKCDANILINSLPYSLRNHLLLTMYKQTTDRLKICKNCPNSDFTIKLLTSFIPLFSKKNGLLIHEGELIENIVFVNDGRLALEASIDMEFPEHSVFQYLNLSFKDISEFGGSTGYVDSSSTCSHITLQNFIDYKRAESYLDRAINSSNVKSATSGLDEIAIGRQLGKYDYNGEFDESNYKYINIINILKNESYGSVYMFLDKPSPLSLRVKSKKAELLLLRKFDAFAISRLHTNIWKRFQRKAYLNMTSVKNLTIKIIKDFSKNNGIHPIQRKQNRDLTVYRDSFKTSSKNMICFSNSSSNQKSKINPIHVEKETAAFPNKEQNNDLAAKINKIVNGKKNDTNINENQSQDFALTLYKGGNKEMNNELKKEIKNEEKAEIPQITINRINQEDQNDTSKNTTLSFKKANLLSIKSLNNQTFSGSSVSKRKTSNVYTASFVSGQKKSNNFEIQCISFGGQSESKKGSSVINSGVFSFCDKGKGSFDKSKNSDKKIGNEKTENRSEVFNSFNNQTNQEFKSTNMSNPLITNKRRTRTQKRNSVSSVSSIGKKQKSKLNSIGKIRLRFVKKLTKKIKKLKTEKNKYKAITKSLTQDFNEFVRMHTTNAENINIKNNKTLDDAENKEIVYDIEDKTKNQIQTQNNIINNVTVHNNNKFLVQIPEFSSSESSDDISSDTHSRNFDLNEITISPSVRFMCKSKYKNLNAISMGYYAKSKKLRKTVKNVIKGFLSIKKSATNDDSQKNNKKIIELKKLKTCSSKTDSLNDYNFHVYTDNISKNLNKSSLKMKKDSLEVNPGGYNSSNILKRFNSIHVKKKYDNGENNENINDSKNIHSHDNSNDNSHDNHDKNYYTFVVTVPKDQQKGDTNIIKLQNMNYLSISPSRQAVKSSLCKSKKSSYTTNNLKQTICNKTEYEFEHIFTNNNNICGNLKKSCSANENNNNNIMKISSINSFYIRDRTKYQIEKKMEIENVDKSIKDKNNENLNVNNKNYKEGVESSNNNNNNNCYIF